MTLEVDVTTLEAAIAPFLETGKRVIIAVAGPPGAGKSTLAAKLVEKLGASAALVPMDGFHLDNVMLDAQNLRAKKGAPETFDAHGFVALMDRIAKGREDVIYPTFDRTRDIAIAGSACVTMDTHIVVVEGNYLLLNEAPWNELAQYFDLKVLLAPPSGVLETRLIQRWIDHGYNADEAKARAQDNDIPNALYVLANSVFADITLG